MIPAKISFREVTIGNLHVRNGALHEGGVKSWEIVLEIGGREIVIGHGNSLAIDMGIPELRSFGTPQGEAFLPLDQPRGRAITMQAQLHPEALSAAEQAVALELGGASPGNLCGFPIAIEPSPSSGEWYLKEVGDEEINELFDPRREP